MVWGLTGGLVAGVVGARRGGGPPPADARSRSAWLELVAERTAHAPLGELQRRRRSLALAGGLAVAVVSVRHPARRRVGGGRRRRQRAHGGRRSRTPPVPLRESLSPGVVRWHAGGRRRDRARWCGRPLDAFRRRSVLESLRRVGCRHDRPARGRRRVGAGVGRRARAPRRIRRRRDRTRARTMARPRSSSRDLTVRVVAVPGRLVVDACPAAHDGRARRRGRFGGRGRRCPGRWCGRCRAPPWPSGPTASTCATAPS